MAYSRDGKNVTLEMTLDEYNYLLFLLGVALGASHKDGGLDQRFYHQVAFVNSLNVGNPDWIPYEIPEPSKPGRSG